MAINVKKYTKDQMAKMVEDAQEKTAALEAEIIELKNCIDKKNDLIAEYANLKAEMQRKNVALTEHLDQINGEAINKANEIASLKADTDALRNKLADTEAALGRANSEMAVLRHDLTCEQESSMHLASVCRWLSDHPWGNLWAWLERKFGCVK